MKKLFISLIAILWSVSLLSQNSANLKMNLEKNKVYRLRSVTEQTILQTVNGNQQTIESKTEYVVSIKMVDATADLMIAEVHFDTLITNTNAMGKVVLITSAKEGNLKSSEMSDVMSCIMNRLSKNALYVKMDYSGKVNEIVNAKMLSEVVLQDTSSITGQMASALKKQIVNQVSDKTLMTMVEMFTHYLPGKQVTAGDGWDVDEQMNSGGMMLDIKTTYHLDGISGNSANLTASSEIKASANADPMESGGAKITYDDIKGLTKSNMVIDTSTGLLITQKAKSHIAGNLGVTVPGMNMVIPMDINGITTVDAL